MSAPPISTNLYPIVAQLEPSAEQLPAIVTRGRDVLVSAGAGTGKTRTLTARILALLAEGVPLRSIVAVTFTIRAASEMRNRLRGEVQCYLARVDLSPAERAFWSPIAAQMDAARIGTIHSLCTEILRAHPAEALLDPNFGVLDEAQALLMRRRAVEETLSTLLTSSNEEDLRLAESLGVATLRETLESLTSADIQAEGSIDEQVERVQSALDEIAAGVARFINDPAAIDAIANLRLALKETAQNPVAAGDSAAHALQPTLAAWDSAQAHLGAGEYFDALVAALPIGSLSTGAGNKTKWKQHFPKPHNTTLVNLWAEYVSLPKTTDPRADRALIILLPALLRASAAARARYAQRKSDTRDLDFDDLEARAHALILENESVRRRWQQEVAALLIDEFQDTNVRQRDLLRAIAGDRGILFLVGDAKQSIYRFRGADVSVFRAERERIAQEGGASLPLEHTFRSHAPLLKQLNAMLAGAMEREDAPPADFREPFAPLLSGNPLREPRSAAPWIELQIALGTKGEGALDVAASALAMRLVALHSAGYGWHEMALLCRRGSVFTHYEDAFEDAHIPYVTVAGSGFHDRPEIRDLLNALRAIGDPTDNLALFGFLRSPMVGYSDTDLLDLFATLNMDLVYKKTPGIWWQALRKDRRERAKRAIALLEQLNAMAGRSTVAEVIKRFLDLTQYEAALMRAGNDRAARNLGKLLEDAQGSPQLSIPQFLASIDDLRAARGRSSEAAAESIGSVQIMTVHKAKGLEFPVVAIGDAGAKGGGRRGELLLSRRMGLLLPMKREDDRRSVLFDRAAALEQEMEAAESDRLLYVAATRAREVLIFNGYGGVSAAGETRIDGWLKAVGAPLGLEDAFARTPQISQLAGRGQVSAQDGTTESSWVVLPLAHGASCLVTTDALTVPKVDTPLGESATSRFNSRMIESVQQSEMTPEVEEQAIRVRDDLAWRIVANRASFVPPHVVGTFFHAALEEGLEPRAPRFGEWVEARAAALAIRDGATLRKLQRRLAELLTRYYASDLHAEVQRATWVQREVPFALIMPTASAPDPSASTRQESLFADQPPAPVTEDERLPLRQGIIDLLFRARDGEWHIVDFKTDHITRDLASAEVQERLARYGNQLRDYGFAVGQLVGTTPRLRLCLLDDHGLLTIKEIT